MLGNRFNYPDDNQKQLDEPVHRPLISQESQAEPKQGAWFLPCHRLQIDFWPPESPLCYFGLDKGLFQGMGCRVKGSRGKRNIFHPVFYPTIILFHIEKPSKTTLRIVVPEYLSSRG